MARIASAATLLAVLATVVLRATGSDAWSTAFAVALAILGVRVITMARAAARRTLPWPRLLLPSILLVEGVGLTWRDSDLIWHVRLGTAVALEVAFVVVAIRALRRTADGAEPAEARIARSLEALLPTRIARLAAFELVVVGTAFHFLFGGWRRGIPAGFTYHRESGLRMLLPLLPLLALADVVLLELVVLPHAATWLQIVLHVLAIYGLVWLVGVYASMRARPHRLVDGCLVLHRGILGRLDVPVDQISSIEPLPSFADDWKKRAYCKGAIQMNVPGPSVLELHLREAARPVGVLGEGAARNRVLVAVDDAAAFTAALAS